MNQTTDKKATYDELEAEVLRLRHENELFRRLIFGQKRERYVPLTPEEQLQFELAELSKKDIPEKTEEISYTRKKPENKTKPPSRNLLPAHLPRNEIIIEPETDVTGLKKIGEEITEELEYKPAKFFVNRYIRPKYANPKDEEQGVMIGTLPSRPIEKGIAGPGLLAHVLISKYVDHLPLYRQRQQFKRQAVEIADSTLCDWVKASCNLLEPLVDEIREQLIKASYLAADETPIQVLDRLKRGTTHRGYLWVYHAPIERLVLFDYRKGRSRAGPNQMLKNFKGYLQSDGYTGYDEIIARDQVISVGCFAHARRYFVEAQNVDSERAAWMLTHVQELYKIERQARENELSYDARYDLRQQNALPILAEIKAWLNEQSKQVLPKSAMGKAIYYMLHKWQRLERYTVDGRLEIDNNHVENLIRPVALGRKNYLFAGSHDGARRAAIIYSLVATAKKNDVEPFAYLKDVISRIADHPFKKLAELLPPNWIPSPEA